MVVAGFPDLPGATMAERKAAFSDSFDHLRAGIVREPRGSDVLVGALLTEPVSPDAAVGVIFFNNVGALGMCGHGTIGVVETLRHLGRIGPGLVRLDTPVGPVSALLREDGEVELENVRSYRHRKAVRLDLGLEEVPEVEGDIAYGGNWFFLVTKPRFDVRPANIPFLNRLSLHIMSELDRQGVRGEDGAVIDHVELFSEDSSGTGGADSVSFVMCPGGAYDRSPCGTGTSAKVACLFADGKLKEGQEWIQESVTGGRFRARVRSADGGVVPTIIGRAHVTGEATLIFDERDPYRWGLP